MPWNYNNQEDVVEQKKVSVIMGVYNSEENKLKKAIDSILNQSYKNLELILCNDASTNGIDAFLIEYTTLDHRIIVINNKVNRGLAYSLNRCLKIASGDYIARQDDDDVSVNTRIEKEVLFLDKHSEYAWVGTCSWLYDENGVWGKSIVKEKPSKRDLLFGVPFTHPTIMVRKEAFKEVNGYRVLKKTERTEDYDLYLRLYALGMQGYNIQEFLLYYNQCAHTLAKRKLKHRLDEVACRYEGFKNLGLLPKGYVFLLKPVISVLIPNFFKAKLHKYKYRK